MQPKANVLKNTVHSRNYSFSFTHGNMLPNWSFEDGYYGWRGGRKAREELVSAYGADAQPVTGSYAGFCGWDRENGWQAALVSGMIPVGRDSVYTLSLFSYHVKGIAASPRIFFYSSVDSSNSYIDARNYDQSAHWNFYTYTFKIPEGTSYISISLSTTLDAMMLFDDVILEPGLEASSRGTTGVGITFSDELGREHMSESLVHREFANTLLPSECVNGYVAYATEKLEIGARSVLRGGNLGSGDSIFIDNDVVLRDTILSEMYVDAKKSIRVGDRDSIFAVIRYGHDLWKGNQSYVRQARVKEMTELCSILQEESPIGTSNVSVLNDADTILVPGKYRSLIVRARGKLRLSAGEYYFDRFSVEPSAKLFFDVTEGNVVIHVRSALSINDNSFMYHDSTAKYFIGWKLQQSGTIRLGTISGLAGVFVAPNARIELAHQSKLFGLLYAREVNMMQNSQLTAPLFLFYDPTMRFAASEIRYDDFGRVYQEDFPYIASLEVEGYIDSSLSRANDYFSSQGAGPDAGGYAFSESEYSNKDGRLLKKTVPGEPWRLGGQHVATSGYGYVDNLDIPLSILVLSASPKMYKLSYSVDVENRMSIIWKNMLGQIVQTATSIDTIAGANIRAYRWSKKRFEYNREGKIRRVITPLDVDQNDSLFAIVSEYDAAGRLISKTGPDVGTEKFFYAKDGSVRLTVSEEQCSRNAFSYKDYDQQGRVISMGESVLEMMTDSILRQIAEEPNPVTGIKTEYSGFAYDNLQSCLDAIGSATINTYFAQKNLKNTRGKMVCKWARNPLAAAHIGAEQSLIADFYGYDSLGRVNVSIRYTGVEIDSNRKIVMSTYEFDDFSRTSKVSVSDVNGEMLDIRRFYYDEKGRVERVVGADGSPIVLFSYDDKGQIAAVNIGDKIETKYTYHLHGQIKELNTINRTTGDSLFRQILDYENIEASATEKPRFDGMISKSSIEYGVSGFSDDRVSAFLYDMSGNLVKRTGSAPEAIFSFDKNGRMLTQGYDGNILNYDYRDGSYELSRVEGTIALDSTRDASRPNNFIYDVSGRMIVDSSKNLAVEYNYNGMPVTFVQSTDTLVWREYMLYDPLGWRVAILDYENETLKMLRTDIMVDGQKVLERHYVITDNNSAVAEYRMIRGKSGIVGRVLPNAAKEWYVKDYQGSLVMTLLENEIGNLFTYEPYGAQKKIQVTGDSPAEQYTGKEYSERLGLYYYGARFFDPILGVWLTPDAARQFDNPFYFGGNPVNYMDLDGNIDIPSVENYIRDIIWNEIILPEIDWVNTTMWNMIFGSMIASPVVLYGILPFGAVVAGAGSALLGGLSFETAVGSIGTAGSRAITSLGEVGKDIFASGYTFAATNAPTIGNMVEGFAVGATTPTALAGLAGATMGNIYGDEILSYSGEFLSVLSNGTGAIENSVHNAANIFADFFDIPIGTSKTGSDGWNVCDVNISGFGGDLDITTGVDVMVDFDPYGGNNPYTNNPYTNYQANHNYDNSYGVEYTNYDPFGGTGSPFGDISDWYDDFDPGISLPNIDPFRNNDTPYNYDPFNRDNPYKNINPVSNDPFPYL